jgi:copper chaperone CopZ
MKYTLNYIDECLEKLPANVSVDIKIEAVNLNKEQVARLSSIIDKEQIFIEYLEHKTGRDKEVVKAIGKVIFCADQPNRERR